MKAKHKVWSIFNIDYLALRTWLGLQRALLGLQRASIRREVFINTDCLILVINCEGRTVIR